MIFCLDFLIPKKIFPSFTDFFFVCGELRIEFGVIDRLIGVVLPKELVVERTLMLM